MVRAIWAKQIFSSLGMNDFVERIDASAFQDLDNPELYSPRLSLI